MPRYRSTSCPAVWWSICALWTATMDGLTLAAINAAACWLAICQNPVAHALLLDLIASIPPPFSTKTRRRATVIVYYDITAKSRAFIYACIVFFTAIRSFPLLFFIIPSSHLAPPPCPLLENFHILVSNFQHKKSDVPLLIINGEGKLPLLILMRKKRCEIEST